MEATKKQEYAGEPSDYHLTPVKETGKQALVRKSLLACSTALTSCDQADVVLEPKLPVK